MTRRLRPGNGWQLICIPFAAGAAHAYAGLAAAMPASWDVVGLDAPGHGQNLSPLASDFDELADAYERALIEVARPPYVVLGHSLGGLVAARLARRELPLRPAAFVISGCAPPERRLTLAPSSTSDDGALLEYLRAREATDPRLLADCAFVDYILPILRADLRAVETFREHDRSPVDVPALLLAGTMDLDAPSASVAGWRGRFPRAALEEIHGGHMFVVTEPVVTAASVVRGVMHDVVP